MKNFSVSIARWTGRAMLLIYLCLSWSGCNDFFNFGPKEPDPAKALQAINEFRSQIETEAGANAVMMRSLQRVSLGDVVILDDCSKPSTVILPSSENIASRFEIDSTALPVNKTIATNFTWAKNFDHSGKLGFKTLEAAIDAAFSFADVETMKISLSYDGFELVQLRDPRIYRDKYMDMMRGSNQKSLGNTLVSGVLRGKIRMGYEVFDKQDRKININLLEAIKDDIGQTIDSQSLEYVFGGTSKTTFDFIDETPIGRSDLAVYTMPLDQDIQDQGYVAAQINSVCKYNQVGQTKMIATCPKTGEAIIEVALRQTEAGKIRHWLVDVRNLTDQPMDRVAFEIEIWNAFGQLLGRTSSRSVSNLGPGAAQSAADIFSVSGATLPPLEESRLKVSIDDIRPDIKCF